MKKLTKSLYVISLLFVYSISHWAVGVDDNQVIDALSGSTSSWSEVLNFDFKLKKFKSCDDMSSVLTQYLKKVYNNRPPVYRWGMLDDMLGSVSLEKAASDQSTTANWIWWAGWDFSKTNTQVAWVDEAEIIKTDWKYIYYAVDSYNYKTEKNVKAIYVVKNDSGKMTLVKKLNLPEHFNWIELYVWDWKLTVISTWFPVWDFQKQFWGWWAYEPKTYVIVFDTTNISEMKLLKLHMFEWHYTQSRLIWDNLYVIWSKGFYYYNLYKGIDDINVKPEDIIAKELNLNYTKDKVSQNVNIKWKDLPYNVVSWQSVKCEDIEYLLPDDETIKKYDFNPSFKIVSIINLKDLTKEVKNKVVFWDSHEIHMSLDSLYLTNYLYTNYNFRCWPGFVCPMWWYPRWENTLVHKFDILENADLSYKNTAIVSWNPLNQYSMDEYDSNFRIITSSWYPERATNLFVLDKDLKMLSSLTWLAKWENFQSSRFIWDKLFMVTFEQIDPLFVIDLKDVKNPKVLWELKIPGYSTYLHPYDSNHLIGLGYDTYQNQHWWTQNSWIKIDLYEINYDKKCGDTNLTQEEKKACDEWIYKWIIVKQLYTKTLWTVWSYSDALHNPRMFVWNANKKILLLPANTYSSYNPVKYIYSWFFSWLYALNIDKATWIKELFKVSHIDESKFEEDRKNECEKYISQNKEESDCVPLIDWSQYCPPKTSYVPTYCYSWATVSDYISQNSYKYNEYFVKRALYIWDKIFSISDWQMKSNDMNTYESVWSVELK